MNTSSPQETRTLRVFLIHGVIAIAWPSSPLIDAVAALIDARTQHGSARQLPLVNTA
jgi:hypothetical protein